MEVGVEDIGEKRGGTDRRVLQYGAFEPGATETGTDCSYFGSGGFD